MTRLCPCCNLPAHDFRKIAAATSNDNKAHGVVGFCPRCTAEDARLPQSTRWKRSNRAIDRALASPSRYMCKLFPDPGAAQLALAMLQHPEFGPAIVDALGWGDVT